MWGGTGGRYVSRKVWMSLGWTRNWRRRLKAWEVMGFRQGGVERGGESESQSSYRACVLSSMGSPLVSCWPSASGGRMPFSVASLSERPRIRGNSMKSYSRAPMAPPIMGPTQYTWEGKQNVLVTANLLHLHHFKWLKVKQIRLSYPVVDKVPDQDSRGKGPRWVHSCSSVVHLSQT